MTRATHAARVRHKCDTIVTGVLHDQHDCDTGATRTTRVKTFSHPYIYYMASERLQREEQFHSKNYLLEMSCSHAKMRLKSAPRKLNFLMEKAISKSYALDCSCKCHCAFRHSYAKQCGLFFDKKHFV